MTCFLFIILYHSHTQFLRYISIKLLLLLLLLYPDPSQLSNEKSKALVRDKPEDPDSRSSDMRMLNIF